MSAVVEIPTLTTERLTLRAPKPSDFEAFAAFRASPRAVHVGGPHGRREAFMSFCALWGHWAMRGFGRWIVADRTTDAPLGVVGPLYPEDWPEREIAWSVFEGAEGRGIAYEAAVAARRYAYETLGWTTAISLIVEGNERSIALAKRLGCVWERDHEHPEFGRMPLWRHPGPEASA